MAWRKLATKDYVDSQLSGPEGDLSDDNLTVSDGSLSSEIDLDNHGLTIVGTANQIDTSWNSGTNTLTVGIPDIFNTTNLTATDSLNIVTAVTATEHARLKIQQNNVAVTTYDADIQFNYGAAGKYLLGYDSGDEKFKINSGAGTLGDNNDFTMDDTGKVSIDDLISKQVYIDNQGIVMPSILKINQSGTGGTLDDCLVQFLHDGNIKFSSGFNHGTETYQIHAGDSGSLPDSDPHFELDASGNVTLLNSLNANLSGNSTGVSGGTLTTITAASNPGSIANIITGTSTFRVQKYGDPTNTTLLEISDSGNTSITGSVTCTTLQLTDNVINNSLLTGTITLLDGTGTGDSGDTLIENSLYVNGLIIAENDMRLDGTNIVLNAESGNAVSITEDDGAFTPSSNDHIVPKHHLDTQLATKQASLTFGIADTNSVVVDSGSVATDNFAKFTSSGLAGITKSALKTDLALDEYAEGAITRTGDFTIDATGDIIADVDGGQFTITQTTASFGNPDLEIVSTHDGTTGPQMYIRHDSSSPADDDVTGAVIFQSKTDGDAYFTTGQINAKAEDVTHATPVGLLEIQTYTKALIGSYLKPGVAIKGSSTVEDQVDVTLGSSEDSTTFVTGTLKMLAGNMLLLGGNKLFLDGGSNTYITEASDNKIDFVANDITALTINQGAETIFQTPDLRLLNEAGGIYDGLHSTSILTRAQIDTTINAKRFAVNVYNQNARMGTLNTWYMYNRNFGTSITAADWSVTDFVYAAYTSTTAVTLKAWKFVIELSSTRDYEFELWDLTVPADGTAFVSTVAKVGDTQSLSATAGDIYSVGQDDLSYSVAAGHQLYFFQRWTSSSGNVYSYPSGSLEFEVA